MKYIVTFSFQGDDGEMKIQKSNPIEAENAIDAALKFKDKFESMEGISCTIIKSNEKQNQTTYITSRI